MWRWVLLGALACRTQPTGPAAPTVQDVPSVAPSGVEVPSEGIEQDLVRARAFYASRPLYERPLGVGLDPVEGLGSLSAETCGACHVAIAAEWELSVHAQAWVDPQFQKEIQKSDNRWLCMNCHTPLLVQQQKWAVGLQHGDVEAPLWLDNPTFDASLQDQGITCAACHVRDGVVIGPGLADSQAPHPTRADPAFTGNALCLRCHQAEATYPGKNFVCVFNTGAEWAQYREQGGDKGCIDCHMPRVERPAARGGPTRSVARHWWKGAGIPKIEGRYPPEEANRPGLELGAEWTPAGLALTLTNAYAGHDLPSGDPERWVQVEVRFETRDGLRVGDVHTTRIGQEWTWNPPTKHADTRLRPGEVRAVHVDPPTEASRAVVTGSSHRMSVDNARYHDLLGAYPISVETHRIELTRPD